MIVICSKNQNILDRWKNALHDHHVVNESTSLTQLEKTLITSPDIVILHASLPGLDTLEHLQALLRKYSNTRFLVLSDKPNEKNAFQLLRCGVYGYSNTYLSAKLLSEAIKQIQGGEVWMGKRLTRFLSECLLEDLNNEDTEAAADEAEECLTHLTPKEKEVAKRIAHGCSNKCIANKLKISERTVKAHLTSIFEKTGINDRVHLALLLNSHKYE